MRKNLGGKQRQRLKNYIYSKEQQLHSILTIP